MDSPQAELREALKGVDIVISAIVYTQLTLQYALVDAAKEAGVCDFGIPSVPGAQKLYDTVNTSHDDYITTYHSYQSYDYDPADFRKRLYTIISRDSVLDTRTSMSVGGKYVQILQL